MFSATMISMVLAKSCPVLGIFSPFPWGFHPETIFLGKQLYLAKLLGTRPPCPPNPCSYGPERYDQILPNRQATAQYLEIDIDCGQTDDLTYNTDRQTASI